jgi:hypothetical protein
MPDFDTTVASLRRWAKDHDPHVRAAVELLCWHEHWLRNASFRRDCMESGQRETWIRWSKARELIERRELRGSTSELAILDLAVAIGENRYRLSGMGHAHAEAIVRAFAMALGVALPAKGEGGTDA